jgi:hypothetical protein
MKKLTGNKLRIYKNIHMKAINTYDINNNNIQFYNIEKIVKFEKTSKDIIYFDYITLTKIQKYEDENNNSWFYLK